MNEAILYNLANIAGTLAGFSGAVVVFRRQGIKDWSTTELRYLWFLIGDSFLVILFALLPIPMLLAGWSESLIWAIGGALLGSWLLIATAIALWGEFKDGRLGRFRSVSFVTPLLNGLSLVAVVIGSALWLSTLGILVPRGQALYVVGLMLLLVFSALEFMFFVGHASLDARVADPEPPEPPAI